MGPTNQHRSRMAILFEWKTIILFLQIQVAKGCHGLMVVYKSKPTNKFMFTFRTHDSKIITLDNFNFKGVMKVLYSISLYIKFEFQRLSRI